MNGMEKLNATISLESSQMQLSCESLLQSKAEVRMCIKIIENRTRCNH
jgi:hypothetical protein